MKKTTRFDGGNPGTGTTMWSVYATLKEQCSSKVEII
jgi:hypothetical protein